MGFRIQAKLRQALGSVKDHAAIGKAMIYSTTGQYDGKDFSEIEIAVLRATGHDNGPIDDKRMHEILFLVSNSPSPAASVAFLAEQLSRRLAKTKDPLVALKTLLLIHRLLRGGNRCFEQQIRSAHVSGHLQIITYHQNLDDDHHLLVAFLQKYSAYLEQRVGWLINQAGKLEPAAAPSADLIPQTQFRSSHDHNNYINMVFRRLPKCQEFLETVLNCSTPILSFTSLPFHQNSAAQAAMSNTLKESFQVYVTFYEGVTALLNMFFDLTRPAKALACEILKKAARQTQQLDEFYQRCRKVVHNKSLDYPSLQVISMDHVLALEHCSNIPPAPATILSDHQLHYSTTNKFPGSVNIIPDDINNASYDSSTGLDFSFSSTATLFPCTLDTKISMVWVVFEDDDDDNHQKGLLHPPHENGE